MNPLSVFEELLPRKARLTIYLILFVAALAFSLWQAAQGDWLVFIGSLVTSLVGLLAAGNTTKSAAVNQAKEDPTNVG